THEHRPSSTIQTDDVKSPQTVLSPPAIFTGQNDSLPSVRVSDPATRRPGTTTQPDREKVTLQTVFSAPAMFTVQALSGTTVGPSAFDPKACTMPRPGTTTQPGGGNHPQTVLNRPSNTRHL